MIGESMLKLKQVVFIAEYAVKFALLKRKKSLTFSDILRFLSRFLERLSKVLPKGREKYQRYLAIQAELCNILSEMPQISGVKKNGGIAMGKLDLGITSGELVGMVPGIISEIWGHWSDDKSISTDEAMLIVAKLFEKLGEVADPAPVQEFMAGQAQAFAALSEAFAEEE